MIPLLGDRASLDASTVEVCDHGGPVDSETLGELDDGVARAVVVDERVDVLVAESALHSMRCGRCGSPAVEAGLLLACRYKRGV